MLDEADDAQLGLAMDGGDGYGGDAHSRGPKGKGVRELSKLLHDFGDGSAVGIEMSGKTRQRGSAAGAPEAAAPDAVNDDSQSQEAIEQASQGPNKAAPLKKRPKLRQGDDN